MIPLLPTLKPSQFFTSPSPEKTLPFPLAEDAARVRSYYFARNGVWEASLALGLQAGDEVLMPTYTSGIEVEALEKRGMIPVFYRLTPTLAPDLQDAKRKITARTRMLYCIHYFGFPQVMPPITTFCAQHNLLLFEDNALGFLSADAEGKPLGSTGDAGLFCPRKTLPLPHGGILVLNASPISPLSHLPQRTPSRYSTIGETFSLVLRERMAAGGIIGAGARMIKHKIIPLIKNAFEKFGITHTESGGADFDIAKADWKMSKISARLIMRFDYAKIIQQRRENYQALTDLLKDLDGKALRILFPVLPRNTCPLEYMIVVDNLKKVTEALTKADIECGLHWWWKRPQEIGAQDPVAVALLKQGILLPIHQDLTVHDMKKIAEVIRDAVSLV